MAHFPFAHIQVAIRGGGDLGSGVAYRLHRAGLPRGQAWMHLLPVVAVAQVALGIATLLLAVPISIAALHQLGAVVLLTVSVMAYHATRRLPVGG